MIRPSESTNGPAPRFSVITITRNDLPGLTSTWESLRDQSVSDFEWIVVDGASTDGTLEWLAQLDDPRLTWVSEPDKGIYDAMNKGVARFSGDVVVFMNGGDRFASSTVIQDVDRSQQKHRWYWAYGAARITDADGSVQGIQVHAPFSLGNLRFGLREIPHQAAYFTAPVIRELVGYDPSFGIAADQEFMLRAAMTSEPHVMGEVLAEFLSGGVSYGRRADRFVWETRQMRMRHGTELGGNRVVDFAATALMSAERRASSVASRLIRGRR